MIDEENNTINTGSYIYGGKEAIDSNVARVKYYNEAGYVIKEFNPKDNSFRKFYLNRITDITGNSGTGKVCEGIQFTDGTCVIHWYKTSNILGVASTVIYNTLEDVVKVHGHNGATIVVWED